MIERGLGSTPNSGHGHVVRVGPLRAKPGSPSLSFDHLIRTGDERRRHIEAEDLGGSWQPHLKGLNFGLTEVQTTQLLEKVVLSEFV